MHGRFRVRDNASLTSLDVPQLVFIGPELAIYSNPQLPNCYATNILERLQANGWFGAVTISGNGTGTCPP